MSMLSNMELEVPGRIRLARRCALRDDGTWGSDALLDNVPHDGTTLSVNCGYAIDNNDSLRLDVGAWHVESPAGDDVYHFEIHLCLSWAETAALRDYLSFLLQQERL